MDILNYTISDLYSSIKIWHILILIVIFILFTLLFVLIADYKERNKL